MNNFSLSRVLALVTVGGIATLGAVSATFGAWSPTNISSSSIYCAGNGSAVNPTESYVYGYGYYAAGALGYECIAYNQSGGGGGGGGSSSYIPTNSTPVSTTATGSTVTSTTVPTGIATGVTVSPVRPTRPTRPVVTRPTTPGVVSPTRPLGTQYMFQTGASPAKKGITVIKNKKVDTARPTWYKPTTLAKASTNVADWVKVLPKGDRNASAYVVIPTVGLVAPIVMPNDEKVTAAFANGTFTSKEADMYFLKGALHHPTSALPGAAGNMILGGHSSWYTRDASAYRTVFQGIVDVDASEQVWVFAKNAEGTYTLYKYSVYASYNTTPGDADALADTTDAQITLYTCTPFGGIKGRWVVKAKLISE